MKHRERKCKTVVTEAADVLRTCGVGPPIVNSWDEVGRHMETNGARYRGMALSGEDVMNAIFSPDRERLSPGPIWLKEDVIKVLDQALRLRITGR